MLKCSICGCICDPSDLVNGVCDDCRAEEQKETENRLLIERLLKSECEQMELRLEGI